MAAQVNGVSGSFSISGFLSRTHACLGPDTCCHSMTPLPELPASGPHPGLDEEWRIAVCRNLFRAQRWHRDRRRPDLLIGLLTAAKEHRARAGDRGAALGQHGFGNSDAPSVPRDGGRDLHRLKRGGTKEVHRQPRGLHSRIARGALDRPPENPAHNMSCHGVSPRALGDPRRRIGVAVGHRVRGHILGHRVTIATAREGPLGGDSRPNQFAARALVVFRSSRKRSSRPSALRASAHRGLLLFAQALIGGRPVI
jgi:hypothetical protein